MKILGDSRSYQGALKSATSTTSKFGQAAKVALVAGAAAGFYALGKAAKIGWDEYNQGAKVAAQTNAVIKSTGGVANVTAQHVEDLGTSLMNLSGVDDEVIKSGENVLLTFKNIRNEAGKGNDIFDQTTRAALDMSVALGMDLQSSVMALGKALNDPSEGLTKLTRIGVTFTDKQKDLITTLDDAGHSMAAQKVILKELRSEFGGSAKAAGQTLGGQINILRERFNNWAGDLVGKAIPALQTWVSEFSKAGSLKAKLRVVFFGAKDAAAKLLDLLNVALFGEVKRTPLKLPSGKIMEWKTENTQGLVDVIADAIEQADWGKVAQGMISGIGQAFKNLAAKVPATPKDFLRAIGLDPDKDYSKQFDNWLRGQTDKIIAKLNPKNWAWQKTGNWIREQLGLGQAAKTFRDFGNGIVRQAKLSVSGLGDAFKSLPGSMAHTFARVASAVASRFASLLSAAKSFAGNFVSAIVGGMSSLPGKLAALMRSALNAVIDVWNNLSIPGFHVGLPGPVPDINFGGASLPDIPHVARGGYVLRSGLAVIHKGENVVPRVAGGAPMGRVQVIVLGGDRSAIEWLRSLDARSGRRSARGVL